MGMLAERVDHVIGVDTHRDAHTAAVLDARPARCSPSATVRPTRSRSNACCASRGSTRVRRGWAIESCGSFGSG